MRTRVLYFEGTCLGALVSRVNRLLDRLIAQRPEIVSMHMDRVATGSSETAPIRWKLVVAVKVEHGEVELTDEDVATEIKLVIARIPTAD